MADAKCPSGVYLEEIVTASGLTLKHPLEDPGSTAGVPHSLLDWSGSEGDYASWDALAVGLIGRLEKAWMLLKSWPTTERMPAADYNAFVEQLNSIRDRYARMRKPWTTDASAFGTLGWSWGITLPDVAWDASDEVESMTQIIVDAQCLRQRINETLLAAGGKPDMPGDTGHKPSPEGLGILGTIALVTVGVGIVVGVPLALRRVISK